MYTVSAFILIGIDIVDISQAIGFEKYSFE